VRVHYQCGFDDFCEANTNRRATGWRAVAPTLMIAGYLVLLWLTFTWLTTLGDGARGSRTQPPAGSFRQFAVHLLGVLAPVVFTVPLLLLPTLRYVAGTNRVPWDPAADPRRRRGRHWLKIVLISVLAWAMWLGWQFRVAPDWYQSSLVLTAILYLFLLNSFAVGLLYTVGMRRRWAAQPFLQQPATLEASDDGLVIIEANARHHYGWAALAGYKESADLLLIYLSPYSCWIIPKRAFTDPTDLGRLKAFLEERVGHGFLLPQPSAFPVMHRPAEPLVPVRPPPLPPGRQPEPVPGERT
jgi:hypothetical protein